MRIFLISTFVFLADASLLPKGVPPSRAAFYKRAQEFQCLDGSARIPYDQINDDYCDCADGSDEPGTAACSNAHFYCENKLHTPQMIVSSRVNDGICDCCDGSDEYNGEVVCPNTCDELGKSHREERARVAVVRANGWAKRKEMAKEGEKMKKEMEEGVLRLKTEKLSLEEGLNSAEKEKENWEEMEKAVRKEHDDLMNAKRTEKKRSAATLLFATIDTNLDGKITRDELMALSYVVRKEDGSVDEDQLKRFVNENGEAHLDHFIENSFHSLRQMRRDEITQAKREKEEKEREQNPDKVDDEHEEKDIENIPIKEDDIDKLDEGPEEGIEKHGDDADDIEEEGPVDEFDDHVPFLPFSDDQNKLFEEIRQVRAKYEEIKNKMDDIDKQIRDAEAFSSLDFGEDLAWAPLKGKCLDLEEGEYVYKLCPFEKCTQKEKNGYSETNMGTWKGWDLAPHPPLSRMIYGDGTTCWNGPPRTTKVDVRCGDREELVEASEPGRCEYHFVFLTAAACTDPANDDLIHSEL